MAGSPMSEQKGRFRNEPRTHELALFVSSYFSRETRRGGGGGGLSRWQYIRSALSGPSGPPGPSGPSGPSSDTRYAVRTSGSCNDFTTTVSSVMLVLCNVRPPACRLEEKRREKKYYQSCWKRGRQLVYILICIIYIIITAIIYQYYRMFLLRRVINDNIV